MHSVLYVDDDPDICEVVQAALCLMAGLEVHIAGSGKQAIALAQTLKPDLILMDAMMPGLDGPSTMERIRGNALLADIPVIFLTGKVFPAEVAHFLELGALGVIGKPFDPLTLGRDVFALWKIGDTARQISNHSSTMLEVESEVSSLSDSFLQRTRTDILRLRKMLERAGLGESPAIDEVGRLTHSIHGAGAMFGYPGISAVAGKMEKLIDESPSISPGVGLRRDGTLLQSLLEFTDQLSEALNARQSPSSAGGWFRREVAGDGPLSMPPPRGAPARDSTNPATA
jgi:CheY-like chemotaxis protein